MWPEDVVTRSDLTHFINELANDVKKADCDWENVTLPRFLEAMAAWSEGLERWYELHGIDMSEQPKWRLFADLLMAATMYE